MQRQIALAVLGGRILPALLLCFVFLGIFSLEGGNAVASELDPLVTQAMAHEVLERLAAGDRNSAIKRALSVIPDQIDNSFIDKHRELWFALWRAVAAKVVFVDSRQRVLASISPDGSRMMVVRGESSAKEASGDFSESLPVMLFDTATGAMVMEAVPPEIADRPQTLRAFAPHFSPDSRYAALDLVPSQSVLVLDAQTGKRLREISLTSATGFIGNLGFSPDSRLLAVDTLDALIAIDVVTGEEQFRWEKKSPSVGLSGTQYTAELHEALGWSPDGRFLIGEVKDFVTTSILAVDESGAKPFLDGIGIYVQMVLTHPQNDVAVFLGLEKTLITDAQGNLLAELPGRNFLDVPHFTREGQALSFPHLFGTMNISSLSVEVTDLKGKKLEPIAADYGPFGNFVIGSEGAITGFAGPNTPVTYDGAHVPIGKELIEIALQEIGTGIGAPAVQMPKQEIEILKSREFARAAREKLRAGDSAGALALALKGLPDNPSPADFERYSEASLMLYRASAARTTQVDASGWGTYVVSPEGRNAAVVMLASGNFAVLAAHFTFGKDVRIVGLTHPTVDPRDFDRGSFFSPDGSLLLMRPKPGDRLSLFDGRDGVFLKDLFVPDPVISKVLDMSTYVAGFSPDGQTVAAQNGDRLILFDVGSGAASAQFPLPPNSDGSYMIAGWGKDSELYFTSSSHTIVGHVLVFKNGTFSKSFSPATDTGSPLTIGSDLRISSDTSNMLFTDQQKGLLFRPDGSLSGSFHSLIPGIFVRNGNAIAVFDWSADVGKELAILDFDGRKLTPTANDFALADSVLYDDSGQPVGWGLGGHVRDWSGDGIAQGLSLYLKVWNQLTELEQTAIRADRVSKR
ncbi:WD40 repeat domain-containing protein [Roseibium aggregatum]|uniref:WD40 repeat domain-containing protein n=1 Tax=Roseibium aggregatum TaxID=187304 RepID=A0A0M6YBX4_9HYPH|nr:hypothetical protein [Roseibium aggregatum]CTQ47595.1 hypothetical protein LAL4801_06057 [Roseibium aggregatum]